MAPVASSSLDKLLAYGPLGIISVILIFALISLFKIREKGNDAHQLAMKELRDLFDKEMAKLRDEHNEQLNELRDRHDAEMKVLQERHITKAENWNEKWTELSNKLHTVLESLVRQREPQRDPPFLPAARRGG
jgi:hypothetical protein